MMKPYSHHAMTSEERIFNYRLSMARRVVENIFNILAHPWRCMLGTKQPEPDNVKKIIMAPMCMHNLMRIRYPGMQNNDVDKEDGAG